ncbi:MAG: DUF454 family protein [Planctomycetes bacterium]|nr:DUF454 family protein [Planctomycetota bacterium]
MDLESDQLGDLFAPTRTRRGLVVRVVLFIVGGVLVVYGILGVILPVLPGFPFLLIGMPLLAASSERARGWVNSLDKKFPLTLRLLLRRMKLAPPPKDASPEERARWKRSILITVLIWLAFGAIGAGVAVATHFAWQAWVAPNLN